MSNGNPLHNLFADKDEQNVCPIRYLHNPLHTSPLYLSRAPQAFPTSISRPETFHPQSKFTASLAPLAADIPYYSSIATAYESKFWKESLEAARTFINLLAGDKSVGDIAISDGTTVSKIARLELRPGFKHRSSRSTAYMYPFSIEPRRLEIITVLQAMLFMFDDKYEAADEDQIPLFVSDFVQRLENPEATVRIPNGPLQHYLDIVIQDIHALDKLQGNGGAEMHGEMRKHEFTNPAPYDPSSASVKSYLLFRHQNICAAFVLAAVKFSIGSSVNLEQPQIRNFTVWAYDHLSIINDLYSYEKEARAFERGSTPDLINIVSILHESLGLPDEGAALEAAFFMTMQREAWMCAELEKLARDKSVDAETWEFLKAVLACCSGNAMFSMTCERYGGIKARIYESTKGDMMNGNLESAVKANMNGNGNGNWDSFASAHSNST